MYYSTHILEILFGKKRLRDSLKIIFQENAACIECFLRNVYSRNYTEPDENIKIFIPTLLKYGLISEFNRIDKSDGCSLMFTDVINFELTYNCNKSCPHCLQSNLHENLAQQLSTEQLKNIIFQSFISGLCATGLNFTGGEVLGNRNDFFEILDYVKSLNIPYRINTNSWWAKKKDFYICNTYFYDALALVKFLKDKGMKMFAFSFDVRFKNDFELTGDLIEGIKLCEQIGVYYQLVFTGLDHGSINEFIQYLINKTGNNLRFIIPVQMQMVDIGGAVNLNSELFRWQSNKSECNGKGFYRPNILHIDPYGNIRTCLYAFGLSNVGNATSNSFADIINGFPQSSTNGLFSNNQLKKENFEKLVKPYLFLYKPIIHECTMNIVLSKTMDKYDKDKTQDLLEIHKNIALEMNLLS
jgi:MoaA/NifB/PqqE/SkfB family radical SAM enzyme